MGGATAPYDCYRPVAGRVTLTVDVVHGCHAQQEAAMRTFQQVAAETRAISYAAAELAGWLQAAYPDRYVHCGHGWVDPQCTYFSPNLEDVKDVILVLFDRPTDFNEPTWRGYEVVVEVAG